METLIWLIPVPPLLAFALIVLFTNRSKVTSTVVALTGAGLTWLMSMAVLVRALQTPELSQHPLVSALNWLPVGKEWLKIGVQVDPLTAVMLFFVAWTVLMIFVYSIGYHNFGQPESKTDHPGLPPHGVVIRENKHTHKVPSVEPMYSRFFALISLFAFAMFVLVVSDNLLTLYIGWEIMGFCSYALIGFWYGKPSARDAAVKAFLTTRVGDVFMLLGIVGLYKATGTLNYQAIFANPKVLQTLASTDAGVLGLSLAGLLGLLLFIGTVGKSAQFPLHIWLPDAMEGPTPVSAMIHAATMVSAGVYLSIRIFPLVSAGWQPGQPLTPTMTVMACIGAFTALFAATIAVAQNDIKRVLAYSTISQLGYMIAALGVGAYVAAAFHLMTHAFFKALLFLGSGSVIHGMEHGVLHTGDEIDPQDMFQMGGLRKKMPYTFWSFLIGGFALSGFPVVTAGFWSKDEILSNAFSGEHLAVFITLALAALLTAFYTMRQITLTFLGEPRTQAAEHAHESAKVMYIPLLVLAFFAVSAGWVGIPAGFPLLGGLVPNGIEEFLGAMLPWHGANAAHGAGSAVPLLTSIGVSLGGLFLGWWVYRGVPAGGTDPLQKALGGIHPLLKNKYYIDELYSRFLIRPATWFAEKVVYLFIDRKVIDGFLHAVARAALSLGGFLRQSFDLPVINGAGDAASRGTRGLSADLRVVQSGHIQQYMIVALAVVLVVGAFFLAWPVW